MLVKEAGTVGIWCLRPIVNPFMNELRRAVEDEFAHETVGSDVTLAEMFTVTALLYTLADRMPSIGVGTCKQGSTTQLAK